MEFAPVEKPSSSILVCAAATRYVGTPEMIWFCQTVSR